MDISLQVETLQDTAGVLRKAQLAYQECVALLQVVAASCEDGGLLGQPGAFSVKAYSPPSREGRPRDSFEPFA